MFCFSTSFLERDPEVSESISWLMSIPPVRHRTVVQQALQVCMLGAVVVVPTTGFRYDEFKIRLLLDTLPCCIYLIKDRRLEKALKSFVVNSFAIVSGWDGLLRRCWSSTKHRDGPGRLDSCNNLSLVP